MPSHNFCHPGFCNTWWLFSKDEGRMNAAPHAYPPNGTNLYVIHLEALSIALWSWHWPLTRAGGASGGSCPAPSLTSCQAAAPSNCWSPGQTDTGEHILLPLFLSLSLFTTLPQIVQTTVSAVSTDAQIGVLKAPSKVGSKNCSPIFCFFAKTQRRSIQTIFSTAPEAASAPVVAVEEASEPKGYNYPVPGTHTYFIQKLDRKIL